jgi:hypothetical protein
LLVSWYVGDICDLTGSDKDLGRSRRSGAEDRAWSSTGRVLGGWTIGRSGDVVCGLYHAKGDEKCMFLGSISKRRSTVLLGSTSKPVAIVLVGWPQNHSLRFLALGFKTGRCGLVIWPTKSP